MKKMRLILSSRRGSALLWALVFAIVLGALLASGLYLGTSMNTRGITRAEEHQAYYTAQSILTATAEFMRGATLTSTNDEIAVPEDRDSNSYLLYLLKTRSSGLSKDILDLPEDMGTATLKMELDDDEHLVITVDAVYKEHTSSLQAVIPYGSETTETEEQVVLPDWQDPPTPPSVISDGDAKDTSGTDIAGYMNYKLPPSKNPTLTNYAFDNAISWAANNVAGGYKRMKITFRGGLENQDVYLTIQNASGNYRNKINIHRIDPDYKHMYITFKGLSGYPCDLYSPAFGNNSPTFTRISFMCPAGQLKAFTSDGDVTFNSSDIITAVPTTITSSKLNNTNIFVQGNTTTLKTVSFSGPASQIMVYPGAHLIIDGGTVNARNIYVTQGGKLTIQGGANVTANIHAEDNGSAGGNVIFNRNSGTLRFTGNVILKGPRCNFSVSGSGSYLFQSPDKVGPFHRLYEDAVASDGYTHVCLEQDPPCYGSAIIGAEKIQVETWGGTPIYLDGEKNAA
ncbi:hypothetical protein LJC42_02400 [Eubacteriales bacterium OttesenSCG-928-K08]|nr:hypothetical protein [Eubacteriales bacterium OttesenSCG-928-K08]